MYIQGFRNYGMGFFYQQIMRYFLVNHALNMPNYVRIL